MDQIDSKCFEAIARAKEAGAKPPLPQQILKAGWQGVLDEQAFHSLLVLVH